MSTPGFPIVRPRRLRANPLVRDLVREATLDVARLHPAAVRPPRQRRPAGNRLDAGQLPAQRRTGSSTRSAAARELGIRAFILFGIPAHKDATGSSALDDDGIVQQALRALRAAHRHDVLLITDECFCEYTDHGHCGSCASAAAGSTWTTTRRCRSWPSSASATPGPGPT